MSASDGSNRRNGPTDRRVSAEDRRNSERVSEDKYPRRNAELKDRRAVEDERREPERVTDEAYLQRVESRNRRRASGS